MNNAAFHNPDQRQWNAERFRRRSFSMAEAALAVLVVGTMMVAALNTVTMSAKARSVNASLGKGPALAHGLMSEILQAFYQDPEFVPTEIVGPEIELASYGPTPVNGKDHGMWDDKCLGQIFTPTLPVNAISWEVTRVMFQAKSVGPTNGIINVQLHTLDSSNKPSAAVIEKYPIAESAMGASYSWQTANYSSATDLAPGDGLAFVLAVEQNDADVCSILADNSGGNGMTHKNNAGSPWVIESGKGLPHYVYGKVTTSNSASLSIGPDFDEVTSTRVDFDDVDDYHGWSASPPQFRNGTALPDYNGWTRSATVEFSNINAPGGKAAGSATGAKRITVTVTDPSGAETTIVSSRSRTGSYQQEPSATRTYCSWVGLELQVGKANAALSMGASLANEPALED